MKIYPITNRYNLIFKDNKDTKKSERLKDIRDYSFFTIGTAILYILILKLIAGGK